MALKITDILVSSDWLNSNLENKNLVVLNATILKVGEKKKNTLEKKQIKGARFFDIKNSFSDLNTHLPNTVLSANEFQKKAQDLGINKNSCIVIYDDLGIYSSPRVWWNFQLMGFTNIAVLDGGFPVWLSKNYPIEQPKTVSYKKGNFEVNYEQSKIVFKKHIFSAINNKNQIIIDARSKGRFYGTSPEPRSDVKSGHIPNSISLPYTKLFKENQLKSKTDLEFLFSKLITTNKELIFTCGSGITASILYFVASFFNFKKIAVYDGSWTEWGSSNFLPIEI